MGVWDGRVAGRDRQLLQDVARSVDLAQLDPDVHVVVAGVRVRRRRHEELGARGAHEVRGRGEFVSEAELFGVVVHLQEWNVGLVGECRVGAVVGILCSRVPSGVR